jgi:hypothetical protein
MLRMPRADSAREERMAERCVAVIVRPPSWRASGVRR